MIPGLSPSFTGLRDRVLQLLAKGLGNQVAEWAPLLSGKCLGFP